MAKDPNEAELQRLLKAFGLEEQDLEDRKGLLAQIRQGREERERHEPIRQAFLALMCSEDPVFGSTLEKLEAEGCRRGDLICRLEAAALEYVEPPDEVKRYGMTAKELRNLTEDLVGCAKGVRLAEGSLLASYRAHWGRVLSERGPTREDRFERPDKLEMFESLPRAMEALAGFYRDEVLSQRAGVSSSKSVKPDIGEEKLLHRDIKGRTKKDHWNELATLLGAAHAVAVRLREGPEGRRRIRPPARSRTFDAQTLRLRIVRNRTPPVDQSPMKARRFRECYGPALLKLDS